MSEEGRVERKPEKLDPLRSEWHPIERRNTEGILTFRTSDREQYIRREDGSIRRATPKVRKK